MRLEQYTYLVILFAAGLAGALFPCNFVVGQHDTSVCSHYTTADACFISNGITRCYWRIRNHSCTEYAPTRTPTILQQPCFSLDENACKSDDRCVWRWNSVISAGQCSLVAGTRDPKEDPKYCKTKTIDECADARECRWVPELAACRVRPPRIFCGDAERDKSLRCSITIRSNFEQLLNITKWRAASAAEPDRLQIEQDFWCNVAPFHIYNLTKTCLRQCFDDDDEFFGLTDTRIFCHNVANNTDMKQFLSRYNCSRTGCHDIMGQGLVENSNLQTIMNVNSALLLGANGILLTWIIIGSMLFTLS